MDSFDTDASLSACFAEITSTKLDRGNGRRSELSAARLELGKSHDSVGLIPPWSAW